MEYAALKTNINMPMVGFGTWTLKGQEGEEILLRAIDCGYRLIDTAQYYQNEDIVGSAIRRSGIDRKEFFVTTKFRKPVCTYRDSVRAMSESLERLQMDYVDLLLINEPYDTDLEIYRGLKEAYAVGQAHAIGISNYNLSQYSEFMRHCGIVPFVNQVEAHVYNIDEELLTVMSRHHTRMQAWAPLTRNLRELSGDTLLVRISRKYGKTPAQVALRYLLQKGISIIPKASSVEHMKENIDLFDFELDEMDMLEIAELNKHQSLFGYYD